jgi:hypothetical protein
MMARLAVVLLAVQGEGARFKNTGEGHLGPKVSAQQQEHSFHVKRQSMQASFLSALHKMKGSAAVATSDTTFLPGICTSEEEWRDDVPLLSECNKASMPLKSECVAAGCYWKPKDDDFPEECICNDEASCLALNASWEVLTCGGLGSVAPPELRDATLKAVETGSCADISVWEPNDYSLIAQVVAETCCKNHPASFCAPKSREYGTPCATPEDFNDSLTYSATCDLVAQPTQELCEAQENCGWYGWGSNFECECWGQPDCEEVGGVWSETQCASLRNMFRDPEWDSAYLTARDTGACFPIFLWGDLYGNLVRQQAQYCCNTGESFCEPLPW